MCDMFHPCKQHGVSTAKQTVLCGERREAEGERCACGEVALITVTHVLVHRLRSRGDRTQASPEGEAYSMQKRVQRRSAIAMLEFFYFNLFNCSIRLVLRVYRCRPTRTSTPSSRLLLLVSSTCRYCSFQHFQFIKLSFYKLVCARPVCGRTVWATGGGKGTTHYNATARSPPQANRIKIIRERIKIGLPPSTTSLIGTYIRGLVQLYAYLFLFLVISHHLRARARETDAADCDVYNPRRSAHVGLDDAKSTTSPRRLSG